MPKPQYGWVHQKARRDAMAAFKDGTLCPLCKRPMRTWQKLHLDHTIPVALGGEGGPTRLTHAYCNDSAGAKLGNRLRKVRRVRTPPRKRTLPKW